MKNLLPAHDPEIQKQLSKHSKKTEFANTLHLLRYTKKLRAPESVQIVLDWIAEMNGNADVNNGIGAFYYSEATIAKETGLSLSTVERAIRWLKKHGFLRVFLTWNYEKGKYGSAYKVFASAKAIKILVQAIINKNNQVIETMINAFNNEVDEIVKKLTGSVTGSVTDNKRPKIKDQDKKINNNRLGEKTDYSSSSTSKNPFKNIPPEIVEIAKGTPWSDEEQIKIARKIWNALKNTKNTELTDEVRIKVRIGIRNAITAEKAGQIKNPNKIAEFIYKCVKTELDGFFTKTEVKIEGTQKHLHEHHHHHVFEKKKSYTAMDYMRDKYGNDPVNDFFGTCEEKSEEPKRKILTEDEVTIKDISKEEETEAFNEVMQGRIEAGATKEMLPDWFGDLDRPYVKPTYTEEEKQEIEEKQNEIQAMLAKLHDTSPEQAHTSV